MKQITVISGKGGTGKTTLVASFAVLSKSKVICDCDVDAPDLYLILKPKIEKEEKFYGSKVAEINQELCDRGGKCINSCRFNAIKKVNGNYLIDEISCEGCGVCIYFCHKNAIKLKENLSGHYFISDTKYGKLVHAKLKIAEENSGKLVTIVRNQAKQIAEKENLDYIIIDGPPGIGCPVIASIGGVDLVLVVTEPTLSAIHDAERVIGVARHFNIKTLLCINKYDLNLEMTDKIEKYCQRNNILFIGKIPFDSIVTKAQVNLMPAVEYSNNSVSKEIKKIWEMIEWNLK